MVLFLKYYFKRVLINWKYLLLVLIIGAALGRFISWFIGVKYASTTTYAIQNTGTNTALSSALSLASSFGLGGKTTGGGFDANYFSELSKSRRLIKETLLQKAKVNGKEDLLANHFYYCSKFYKKWDDEESPLYRFTFKHQRIQDLTPLEDSVLNLYYNLIIDKYLTTVTAENNAFNRITYTAPNKQFNNEFLKTLMRQIQAHYKLSIENINTFNFDIAAKRVDSLAEAIRNVDMKVARLKDNAINTIKQQGLVELNNALREQSLLNIQYSSAVNNFESAKTALIGTSPVIQIIDSPEYATDLKYLDPLFAMLAGAILLIFGYLFLLFLFCLFTEKQ